jgi:8-hydroxy-5-deazaflavin:NADPH oxidoreductase
MNIAFIGIGQVGSALAGRLVALGHRVTIAARNPNSESVQIAIANYPDLQVASPQAAVAVAEVDLSNKILVDCTNPVGANLSHGLKSEQSGSEFVQNLVPTAKVVKAFTIYGFENFEDNTYPGYGDLKPVMLIAGDDAIAKQIISTLCQELGWEAVDAGNLAMSLHLEHMTLLWIQMARVQGLGAGFVWARLRK